MVNGPAEPLGPDPDDPESEAEAPEASRPEGSASQTEHVRTPLFRAMNAQRYSRQQRIRDIQEHTGARLICYVSGPLASLTRDDVLPLVDLLHTVPLGSDIDLLLHTPGGDIDAAEKMANMIRRQVGDGGRFRVVVPDYAKSAGTLVSLAADAIVMSESSELGPIDPQVRMPDGAGGYEWRPAQAYVDGYEKLVDLVNKQPEAMAYHRMLDKYDPTRIEVCRKAIERSTKMAEELLKRGMFRRGGNFTAVAADLSNNQKWLQHSTPIDYLQAKTLKLEVTYLEPTDELWQGLWALYCEQRLAGHPDDCKLFESDYVSIAMA